MCLDKFIFPVYKIVRDAKFDQNIGLTLKNTDSCFLQNVLHFFEKLNKNQQINFLITTTMPRVVYLIYFKDCDKAVFALLRGNSYTFDLFLFCKQNSDIYIDIIIKETTNFFLTVFVT